MDDRVLRHRLRIEKLGHREAPDAYGIVLSVPPKFPTLGSLPTEEREAMIRAHTERVSQEMARLEPNTQRAKMASSNTNQKGRWQVLVLSRNQNESVVISINGVEIEVELVQVKSRFAARLGFRAPPEALILRKELIERAKTNPKPIPVRAPAKNGRKPRSK